MFYSFINDPIHFETVTAKSQELIHFLIKQLRACGMICHFFDTSTLFLGQNIYKISASFCSIFKEQAAISIHIFIKEEFASKTGLSLHPFARLLHIRLLYVINFGKFNKYLPERICSWLRLLVSSLVTDLCENRKPFCISSSRQSVLIP